MSLIRRTSRIVYLQSSYRHVRYPRKSIALLGSTGSIGTQTLDIVRAEPERFRVALLSAGRNVEKLIEQAREFRPSMAIIADEGLLPQLREALAPSASRLPPESRLCRMQ